MERLTTDTPKNNLQTALNLFYAKGGEAWVRGGGPEYEYQDVPLFTYIRSVIQHQALSQHLWEDMDNETLAEVLIEWLFNGHETTEGIIATLYTAAWAFAELRARLKAYEDTGLTPEQVVAQKWIPVTERLPEEWTDVLVWSKCGFCVVAVSLGSHGKWRESWTNMMIDDNTITHWMPLPEAPKEE